jgi:hypothetical protein
MHRRRLVIRRFGAMSFALGYDEDGAWVDHAEGVDGRSAIASMDLALWDAAHTFFDCCGARITPLHVVEGAGTASRDRRSPRAAVRSASS